jgi:hypothetical protein
MNASGSQTFAANSNQIRLLRATQNAPTSGCQIAEVRAPRGINVPKRLAVQAKHEELQISTRDKAPSPPVLFEKTIATVSQVEGIGVNEWCNLLNVLVLVCRI